MSACVSAAAPKKVVLIAGSITGHPKDTHEYEKNVTLLKHLLDQQSGKFVAEAHYRGWPTNLETLYDADTIFFTTDGSDRKEADHPLYVGDRMKVIEQQMRRGCGIVFFHWSTFHPKRFHDQITEWNGGYFDYESGPPPRNWYSAIQTWQAETVPQEHPITRGVKPFRVEEEFYYRMRFRETDPRLKTVVMTRPPRETQEYAVGWAVERQDGGRGFGFTGGHFYKNWWASDFRKLVLNAIAWTAKAEVPANGIESTLEERAKVLITDTNAWQVAFALEQDPRLIVHLAPNADRSGDYRLVLGPDVKKEPAAALRRRVVGDLGLPALSFDPPEQLVEHAIPRDGGQWTIRKESARTLQGLAVTFTGSDGKSHTGSSSNIALYVAQNEAASPFIAPGPFTAVWEGNIHAELRGEFHFQAELTGALRLEINTKVLTDLSSLSKAIRLNKGANKIRAAYTSPKSGDAFLRLSWTETGTNTSPVPTRVLSHSGPDTRIEMGRELFLEHRCNKCHVEAKEGVPELGMDAPSFERIGARRNAAWMARWILNPKGERASTRMPQLARDAEEAEAMAAFLASLSGDNRPLASASADSSALPPEGKTLYDALLCTACHDDQGISLAHVAEKFPPGKLTEYLLAPEAHFAWTRMPNFKLSQTEAETLAKHLLAGKSVTRSERPPEALIERGRLLVQSRGCLNCHQMQLETKSRAPKLGSDWNKGCVAGAPNAPQFAFTPAEREALEAFGRTDRGSLKRHVPAEFAERHIRLLNCRACHAQQELFPPVDILGGKLRPEWMGKFIAGEIAYKPRAETHPSGEPWLFARMPAFTAWGHALGYGMAAGHGYAPKTPAPQKIEFELAKLGQKLVGKDGGFSCVSCHGVGEAKATDVFDSEGINLAWSAQRLLPQYYRRWVRNPLSIDPQTKMPVYFDEEGRSPLTEILDGDAEKQITAIWHYLLLGEKMPPP